MENILSDSQNQMQISELLAYFSCEIFCIIGIILNFFFLIFFKRKLNIKRISDFITSGVFVINNLILAGIFAKSFFLFDSLNFSFWNDLMAYNKESLILKFLINLFMLIFILITYKITRKAKFKTPVINSILLLIVLVSGILVQAQNFILIYILLDILALLIYKYASNMRIRKDSIYSLDFIFLGVCATVLFLAFYSMTFIIQDSLQLSIIQVCMTIALFLKIGLFPIYNYLMQRRYKVNIPYSILLFCYLPWLGVIAFNKMSQTINCSEEVYQISMAIFVVLSLVSFSLHAFKQKNLIKFLANVNYTFVAFSILNIFLLPANNLSVEFTTLSTFCILGIYSLLCILKINLKIEKLNISLIKGIFFNNRAFSLFLAVLLLILTGVIPSRILSSGLKILNNIYVFDKATVYAVIVILAADILILFNSLKIIQNCYNFDIKNIKEKFAKRTTLNYVVPFVIILFLIGSIFL